MVAYFDSARSISLCAYFLAGQQPRHEHPYVPLSRVVTGSSRSLGLKGLLVCNIGKGLADMYLGHEALQEPRRLEHFDLVRAGVPAVEHVPHDQEGSHVKY